MLLFVPICFIYPYLPPKYFLFSIFSLTYLHITQFFEMQYIHVYARYQRLISIVLILGIGQPHG